MADTTDLIDGYSLGLYSTWVWYRPLRILFDAGEGLGPRLQNGVYAIRTVFLSHGHLDHISGLPTLVNVRNSGMGDPTAPLDIVHPAGDPFVGWMRDYLERSSATLSYPLTWRPIEPGDRVPLDDTRSVEAFPVQHTPGQHAFGYRVLEHRRRLRPEWRDRSEGELRQAAREQGRDALMEPYDQPVLVYGGDGMAPAPAQLAEADVALLDATFLRAEDRGRPTHATVDEAVAAAERAGVRSLVLMHVSGRYRLNEAREAVLQAAERHGFDRPLRILWRERMVTVRGETPS